MSFRDKLRNRLKHHKDGGHKAHLDTKVFEDEVNHLFYIYWETLATLYSKHLTQEQHFILSCI